MRVLIGGKAGIQARFSWVLVVSLALFVVSVSLTFWGLSTQRQDARVINLAGRQRMLAQQMAREALLYEQEGEEHYRSDLVEASGDFDQTLQALRHGGTLTDYTGQIVVLQAPADPGVAASLDLLAAAWQPFQAQLDVLMRTGTGAGGLESQAPVLVEGADQVVRSFEAVAQAKITRLHRFQLAFLAAGLALVAAGWWILRISVVQPVRQLEESARSIGAGDLESPVTVSGPAEVQALGSALEATRRQLALSRDAMQAGVDTLEQRVQQRTAELAALAAISREISSHLDLGAVLRSVTDKAQQLLGGEVAELCLLDVDQNCLRLRDSAGPEIALRQATSPVDDAAAGSLLRGRTARACPAGACPGFCEILDPAYRVSHLAAPVALSDRVIGALCVGSTQSGAFSADALALLTQLAEAAAVALENSRLYAEAQSAATLLERQRIAAEMHDGLLQTLSFLRLIVQLTEEQLAQGELSQAAEMLRKISRADAQAESETRRAIASLQEDLPLQATLQEQLAGLLGETNGASPVPHFENRVNAPIVLPRQDAEQVLRVVHEAVLNAQRHSQAREIRVCLERSGSQLSVTVADDGQGFCPEAAPVDDRPHYGLKIMRARAARLGGELLVDSAPRPGTRVTLRWSPEEARP